MAEIMLLDSSTIDKIAAGEVVERPSSVVKELVENAMDAGARAVTVEIKEGGCSFIRVTDNGGGIEKEQVRKAFFRHATSKIRTVEDLYQVKSLGFRGEALSSIAAVSMVELITKTRDELTGIHYRLEGEKEREFSEVGAPEGTTIIVRELFFNTPVRPDGAYGTFPSGSCLPVYDERTGSFSYLRERGYQRNSVPHLWPGNHKGADSVFSTGRGPPDRRLPGKPVCCAFQQEL